MSPSILTTTRASQSQDDTTPLLLAQNHTNRTTQSSLSRFICKIKRQPNDMTLARELTEWSRQGTTYLENKMDAAFYQHFKDKIDRKMETNLDYRPEPSVPTNVPIKRILNILDNSVHAGTLKESLNGIDTKIWLLETARSGTHGSAARGYGSNDKSLLPLDWLKVRELRDQAVKAAEARVDAIDEANRESRSYETNEFSDGV